MKILGISFQNKENPQEIFEIPPEIFKISRPRQLGSSAGPGNPKPRKPWKFTKNPYWMIQEAPNRLHTTSKNCFVLLWSGSRWFDTLWWAHFEPDTIFRWKMMWIHRSCTRPASCRSSAGPSGETLEYVEVQRISMKSIGFGLADRLKISPDLKNLRKFLKIQENPRNSLPK